MFAVYTGALGASWSYRQLWLACVLELSVLWKRR